jgi:hypothetical protein
MIAKAGPRGFEVYQEFMRKRLAEAREKQKGQQVEGTVEGKKSPGDRRDRRTEDAMLRDAIILTCLSRDLNRFEICRHLDMKDVPTLRECAAVD